MLIVFGILEYVKYFRLQLRCYYSDPKQNLKIEKMSKNDETHLHVQLLVVCFIILFYHITNIFMYF